MLVAAAVCPHPPLLVPGLGAVPGIDDELDELRAACRAACRTIVTSLVDAETDVLVVVGVAASTTAEASLAGELTGYGPLPGRQSPAGEPASTELPTGEPPTHEPSSGLPLPLGVGAWLLAEDAGWQGDTRAATIAVAADERECLDLGERLAAAGRRVALLVMSDGSASRHDGAPLTFHPRAADHDAAVVAALRSGQPDHLLALDGASARQVGSTGLSSLWVLAGAARADLSAAFDATVLYDGAPYGVGYAVSVWLRQREG